MKYPKGAKWLRVNISEMPEGNLLDALLDGNIDMTFPNSKVNAKDFQVEDIIPASANMLFVIVSPRLKATA
jgi:hypothetical protein